MQHTTTPCQSEVMVQYVVKTSMNTKKYCMYVCVSVGDVFVYEGMSVCVCAYMRLYGCVCVCVESPNKSIHFHKPASIPSRQIKLVMHVNPIIGRTFFTF